MDTFSHSNKTKILTIMVTYLNIKSEIGGKYEEIPMIKKGRQKTIE